MSEIFAGNPGCDTQSRKKPYESPEIIELGNVSELTNYSVSVEVSGLKNSGENRGSGDSYEA